MKKYIVKKAGKKGKGLFANKNFKKGELILDIIPGRIISKKEAKKVPDPWNEYLDYHDKNHYYFMGYPEYYINHSCDPNVYGKKNKLYAMKNIKKGDELCFDYSINGVDKWQMKCKCGSKICRGIVKGEFFKLPKELQLKYIPFLDNWFVKEFKNKIKKLK